MTLDEALDEFQVEECDELNRACLGAGQPEAHPTGWFAVTGGSAGGAVAYFNSEHAAAYYRLCLVNESLNGERLGIDARFRGR